MRDFRDLKVWEKAHHLALAVYRTTATFPPEEVYGLTSQMRRSGASIPTNIAEGCGRESNVDFARLLQIAAGSASELEYQLLLAHDLGFITPDDHARLSADAVEVKRMLSSFMAYLRTPQRGRARHQVRDARIDEPGYLTPDT